MVKTELYNFLVIKLFWLSLGRMVARSWGLAFLMIFVCLSVLVKFDQVQAQGPAVSCRGMMVKYGEESIMDMTGDGEVNIVDLMECVNPVSDPTISFLTVENVQDKAIPGELLIKLKDIAQLENLSKAEEVERVRRVGILTMADLNYVQVFLKDKTVQKLVTLANYAKLSNEYDLVTPNWTMTASASYPNDPLFSSTWGDVDGWNLKAIQAPEAWDLVTGTRDNPGIFAGVMDSGVKLNHQDLAENLFGNFAEWKGGEGIDDDNNQVNDDIHGVDTTEDPPGYNIYGPDPAYDQVCDGLDDLSKSTGRHGTRISGVVAAIGNNSQGLAGVNWNARLLNIKVSKFDSTNNTCATQKIGIMDGFSYATHKSAPVLNYSISRKCTCDTAECTNCNESFSGLIQAQQGYTHNGSGGIQGLLVSIPGNDFIDIDSDPNKRWFPCGTDNEATICVTSTVFVNNIEQMGQNAYGSQSVDLAAPGQSIITTDTATGYEYAARGSSVAAPHVTGAILLMLQENPNLSLEQVRDIIFATVDTKDDRYDYDGDGNWDCCEQFGRQYWIDAGLDPDTYALEGKVKTGGRLNLYKAVKCADDIGNGRPDCLDTVPQPTPTPTFNPQNYVYPVRYLPEYTTIGEADCVFDNPEGLIGPPDNSAVYAPHSGGLGAIQCHIHAVYDMGGLIDVTAGDECAPRFYTSRPAPDGVGDDGACYQPEYQVSDDPSSFTGPSRWDEWQARATPYGSPTEFEERVDPIDSRPIGYKWRYIKMVNDGCGWSNVYWETIAVPSSCFTPISFDNRMYMPVILKGHKP